MKICNVEFENLNSLAGKWRIDFEAPEYADGLFAIVGETGAGKTTILDAITLALYGETSREKISKEVNEVMTRGTGSCYAQVEFSVGESRYVATWEQHRSRKAADGALQQAQMSLTDLTADRQIECHGIDALKTEIANRVGVGFEQFQRTFILPQGDFDEFLRAKHNERAAILEKATGTQDYTELGRRIHEQFCRKEATVKEAQAKLDNAKEHVLPETERQAHENALRELNDAVAAIGPKIKKLNELNGHLSRLIQEDSSKSREVAKRDAVIKEFLKKKTDAEKTCGAKLDIFNIKEQALLAAGPKVETAVRLRPMLNSTRETLNQIESDITSANRDDETEKKKLNEAERSIKEAELIRDVIQSTLASGLCPPVDGLPRNAVSLIARYVKLVRSVSEQAAKESLFREECGKREKQLREISEGYNEKHEAYDRDVNHAFQRLQDAERILGLQDKLSEILRTLDDGQPCPLCGALHHPRKESGAEYNPEVNEKRETLRVAKEKLAKLNAEYNGAVKAEREARQHLDDFEKQCEKDRKEFDLCRNQLETERDTRSGQVWPLSQTVADCSRKIADIGKSLAELEKRRNEVKKSLTGLENELTQLGIPMDVDPLDFQKKLQTDVNEAREGLEKARRVLDEAVHNVDSALLEKDNAVKLSNLAAEELKRFKQDNPEWNSFADQIQESEALEGKANQRIGELRNTLDKDDRTKEEVHKYEEQQCKAEEIKNIWEQLDGWIGGVNGDRFRRYVQRITLGELLDYANPHLMTLTRGQYQLRWDGAEDDLLPYIEDANNDALRPVTNLSGGERFQVSLALALGLSELSRVMANNQMQVETLFIDEGFGTLGTESLRAALNTLHEVKGKNKLIGFITHVDVAVPTRIEAKKLDHPAHSKLEGPGVGQPKREK